jgi:hypothetical protein
LLNVIAGIHGTGVAPVTNSYESIATVTVGGGGSSSITFSSIPSTFKHLQIRAIARNSISTTEAYITLNGATNASYRHLLYGDGSAAAAFSATNGYLLESTGTSQSSNVFGVGVIDILDYANTNKNKTIRSLTGYDNNGSGIVGLFSGLWATTSAITSITVTPYPTSNFVQYSHFALYGIRG